MGALGYTPFYFELRCRGVLLYKHWVWVFESYLKALFFKELGDLAKLTVTLACTDVKSDLTNSRVAEKLVFNY